MKVTEKERKIYIQEIKRNLVCDNKQRKKFLSSFSDNMDEYLNNNPDADFAQLQKDLGTPEEIANAFLENASASNVKKRISFVKRIILGVIVALAVYITAIIIVLIDAHNSNNGYGKITTSESMVYYDESVEEKIINSSNFEE